MTRKESKSLSPTKRCAMRRARRIAFVAGVGLVAGLLAGCALKDRPWPDPEPGPDPDVRVADTDSWAITAQLQLKI